MDRTVLQIDTRDNVVVALVDHAAGEAVGCNGRTLELRTAVPAKHKFALRDVPCGAPVKMYGVIVAQAVQDIHAGELIHTGNVRHATGGAESGGRSSTWQAPDVSPWHRATFEGYHRRDGRVGTANMWLVVPLVFCENTNIHKLRDALLEELGYGRGAAYRARTRGLIERMGQGASAEEILSSPLPQAPTGSPRIFPHVDGIAFLTHNIGCGGTREDAANLCGLIAGYIDHPNVAGATVLSLGCQNAQVSMLKSRLRERSPSFDKPLVVLEQQRMPSESHLIDQAIRQTFAGLMQAEGSRRRPAPLAALTVGLECGASDGFSGISANPAIGHCADLLVALGGSVILSEFPELAGAEADLVGRCTEPQVAERFLHLMTDYAARAEAVRSSFEENPSPANIADGLVTDAIKSLGAAKKGGTSPVVDVLDYTEPVRRSGLNLLCTPGGDVESTTAMVGSGANLVLFSTGMGTPTGNAIAPVLKISSNRAVAERLPDMIDLDAGGIVRGEESIASVGQRILARLIDTASGRYIPCARRLDQNDFLPWKRGVSL